MAKMFSLILLMNYHISEEEKFNDGFSDDYIFEPKKYIQD